jgi:hypothetical protein
MRVVARLTQHALIDDHDRIRAEHVRAIRATFTRKPSGDRLRFASGQPERIRIGRLALALRLVDSALDHLERKAELAEDVAPPRRRRREHQRFGLHGHRLRLARERALFLF